MQLTPSRQGYREDLNLALVIADSVDALTMSRYQSVDLKVDTKPDMTPVSDADRAAEELIRQQLKRARPRDAVTGEEYGTTGSGKRRWIIDPIDGTKNFVRGVPVWATLIALVDDGRPVVGVVSAPALSRRWWAYEDGGAYTGKSLSNATRIHASDVTEISDASLSFSSLEGWRDRGNISEFLNLAPQTSGGYGPLATSGPTCWLPKVPSTLLANLNSNSTTWPHWSPSSPKPAGPSPHWTANRDHGADTA